MREIEKVYLLKQTPIFVQVKGDHLMALARFMEERYTQPGEVIVQKGDDGETLYLVAAGRFQVSNKDQVLAQLGPGSLFGELAALVPEKRTATVTAIDEGLLLSLSHDAVQSLILLQPEIALDIIEYLVRRIRENPYQMYTKTILAQLPTRP